MDSDSEHSWELGDEEIFERDLERVRRNDPRTKRLCGSGIYGIFQGMTNEDLEDIGRDISNNTYLEDLEITYEALNEETLSSLFRGLTRSSSITRLELGGNEFSAAGLRSLEPFLQNSIKLRELNVDCTNLQTERFNILMRALRDSPVESLYCNNCSITSIEIETMPNNLRELLLDQNNIKSEGFNRLIRSLRQSNIEDLSCEYCRIESIEIVTNSFPRSLKRLDLANNRINSNGCHGIAKLLQEGGITLETLILDNNVIDDEGVVILVDALKTNTSLTRLDMKDNDGISRNGRLLILKMLNDISSIKATLQSNHTLQCVSFGDIGDDIHHYTNMATTWNMQYSVRAGREKVIRTQLHSQSRAKLTVIQGIQHSLYGEIKPLHLPEVLSLVGNRHGQKELYVALKASIAEVMSTVNRKRYIQQRIAYHSTEIAIYESVIAEHRAKQRELRDELATLEGEPSVLEEQRSTKRRRE